MTSFASTYCNITTDLQLIEPNIDDYDRKRTLDNLIVHFNNLDQDKNVSSQTLNFY